MSNKEDLHNWLKSQPPSKDSMDIVLDMPASIRKLILEEITNDMRSRRWPEELKQYSEACATREMAERFMVAKYLGLPGVRQPYTLTGLVKPHDPDESPVANILINSSLFTISHRGHSLSRDKFGDLADYRPKYEEKDIACPDGFRLCYKGERLSMFDLKVLLVLIDRSKEKFDTEYSITPTEILGRLNLPRKGRSYKILKGALDRLYDAKLYFAKRIDGYTGSDWKDNPRAYDYTIMHLLDRLTWLHGERIRFSLDGRLTHFYANYQYALINLENVSSLPSELAQKLYCMFCTQKQNRQRHRLDKIRDYADIHIEDKHLVRPVQQAMNTLLEKKLIAGYWMLQPAYGKAADRALVVWCDPDTPDSEIIEQAPRDESGKIFLRGDYAAGTDKPKIRNLNTPNGFPLIEPDKA